MGFSAGGETLTLAIWIFYVGHWEVTYKIHNILLNCKPALIIIFNSKRDVIFKNVLLLSHVVANCVLPTLTIPTKTIFSTAMNSKFRKNAVLHLCNMYISVTVSVWEKQPQFCCAVLKMSLKFTLKDPPPKGCQLNHWPFSSDCHRG